jgi:hypothetical protein
MTRPLAQRKTEVTLPEHLIAGSTAAVTDVFITHPLSIIKNRIQCRYPFSLAPQVVYKGVAANALSMIPLVTIQVGFSAIFRKELHRRYDISHVHVNFIASFLAGNVSSLVTTPTELVLVQQQKKNLPFVPTATDFLNQQGFRKIFTGLFGTALRTGFVSTGFISLMPYLKSLATSYDIDQKVAVGMSGFSAGFISAVLSQPFDTIKTNQQHQADEKPESFKKTAYGIIKKDGYLGLFSGGMPRGIRVIVTTTILGEMTHLVEHALVTRRLKK